MVEARAEGKLEAGMEAKEDMKIAGSKACSAGWSQMAKKLQKLCKALVRKREVRGSALTWRKAVP